MSNKKAKNILVIINLYASAEFFLGNQFSFLRENGYNMHLICSDDSKLSGFAERQGIEYRAIKLNRQLSVVSDIIAVFQICKYIKEHQIDTVIAHQAKARLLGMVAAFVMRVPNRIIFAHGVLYETMHGLKRSVIIMMDRFVAALSHKIVCVSNSVANVRIRDKINKGSKQTILNKGTCGGIDTENIFNPALYTADDISSLKNKFSISGNDFVIGFCGRLVKDKGIVELLGAFDLILKENLEKQVKLLIIGNNEVRDSIPESSINIIENNSNIVFTGFVSHDEIAKYYMMMDVFVLPSYREGFPTVILEASAMGTPCVVSKSTGCIDSIEENVTGVYTDIDSNSIRDAILPFMNVSYRDKFSKYCRQYIVDNYDHKVVWPYIIDVIEK